MFIIPFFMDNNDEKYFAKKVVTYHAFKKKVSINPLI